MKQITIFFNMFFMHILLFANETANDSVNEFFGNLNSAIATVLFFDLSFGLVQGGIPFTVAWLVVGAIYFTFKMKFINFRAFRHAILLTLGKYDRSEDKGEINHFQALTTALSATVGLGNIAGVAVAVGLGGPGATFWIILAGLLGMTFKFAECTLGQMYREVRHDGHIMGGPMLYLHKGLSEMNLKSLGKVLSIVFAFSCMAGSLGGGAAFQVNQSLNVVKNIVPIIGDSPWIYGAILTILVAIVIIGGVTRIATTASHIVPFMCTLYVIACLYVLIMNVNLIPEAFVTIVSKAFRPDAMYGGAIGVLILGFKRAAFSNEAGLGSATIAHSAAKTEHPIQEGLVALLEPFIDTIVICTMTALVIVITGTYNNPEYAHIVQNQEGATLTALALGSQVSWFPFILAIAVVLFAYSTIISWSYYGERCFSYVFSEKYVKVYQIILLTCIFLGAITTSKNILEFSDLMMLSMGIPNILGLYILRNKIKNALLDYKQKLASGEIRKHS